MATNSNGSEQLQAIEKAIRGVAPRPHAEAAPERIGVETIMAFAEALAERIEAAGKYAREHGAYIDEVSIAFARQLQQEAEQYAASLLASERRKMDELQKIMGKTGQ